MINSADDLLIFLHLPKAGGTTLRELIGRQYAPDRTIDLRNDRQIEDDLQSLSREQRDRMQALAGHVNYGVHEHFTQSSTYFTFLRHPVDRLVSHYHYVRNNPRHFLYTAVTSANLSLLDYVQSGLSEELSNDQTRRLAGTAKDSVVNSDDLALARKHLASHFCVAGVVERFDESLLLLSQARGWQRPYYLCRNVGTGQPGTEISTEERAAILDRNDLDLQLYDLVRQKLDHAIEARGPTFMIELERFRHHNRQYQHLRGSAEGLLQPVRDVRARLRAMMQPQASSNAA